MQTYVAFFDWPNINPTKRQTAYRIFFYSSQDISTAKKKKKILKGFWIRLFVFTAFIETLSSVYSELVA